MTSYTSNVHDSIRKTQDMNRCPECNYDTQRGMMHDPHCFVPMKELHEKMDRILKILEKEHSR